MMNGDFGKNGAVVSDLHLYTRRSKAPYHMDEITEAVQKSEHFVLNGDIVDFKWSTVGGNQKTVEEAVGWLEWIITLNPSCRIYYVVGNHDNLKMFNKVLKVLAKRFSNFSVHHGAVKIGANLFLHGDMPLNSFSGRRRRPHRRVKRKVRNKGEFAGRSYALFTKMGVHKLVLGVHTKFYCAWRLMRYLKQHRLLKGVTDVYFGHTHTPFCDYVYKGIVFHNTGAMVENHCHEVLFFRG